jgi:hypothetical protein
MTVAGRFIGFSPSGAHKGWGRFTPNIDWNPAWGDKSELRLMLDSTVSGEEDSEEAPAENGNGESDC